MVPLIEFVEMFDGKIVQSILKRIELKQSYKQKLICELVNTSSLCLVVSQSLNEASHEI